MLQQQRHQASTPPIIDLGPSGRGADDVQRTKHQLLLKENHTVLLRTWARAIDDAIRSMARRWDTVEDYFRANHIREYLPDRFVDNVSVTSLSQSQKPLEDEAKFQVRQRLDDMVHW